MLTAALVLSIVLTLAIIVTMARVSNAEVKLIELRAKRGASAKRKGQARVPRGEQNGMLGGVDASDLRGPDVFR